MEVRLSKRTDHFPFKDRHCTLASHQVLSYGSAPSPLCPGDGVEPNGGKSYGKGDPMKEEQPRGALALTLIYMVTIIVLWSWVYMALLQGGVTR